MTDTTASSASPDPQDTPPPTPLQNGGEEFMGQPFSPAEEGWEPVALPGQLPLADSFEPLVAADASLPAAAQDQLMPAAGDVEGAAEPAPENLVQLIQDLNQCNDALLLRVTELEDDLERSQVALQAEIERTQIQPGGLPVEATPGPVQQQIAQLLSELDIANDGLRRTTIHNETLQAELEVTQQRVAQLERECTLLQQRFSEKNTALHQAEETCRDLKARLHRQQRYTLQFKAALEKCLNMAGSPPASSAAVQGQLLDTAGLEVPGQPVTMPRSQQIQPWSAGAGAVTDNPSLTHLLRGLRGAGPAPVSAQASPPDLPRAPESRLDLAEQLAALSPNSSPAPASVANPEPTALDPVQPAPDPWLEAPPVAEPVGGPASVFTEPSPWGEPMAPVQPVPPTAKAAPPEPQPTAQTPAPVPVAAPGPSVVASAPALPTYLMPSAKASPSPLVYPLRSQKKIKSIAAVELPSFGRTVRRR
ncbi:hypothetical protein [Nodosilinea nodulosa]|uniref:hypothetical protein n=1 Tax=Nodosilinea nodulosa TaxID=416001 RepID=UPI0012D7E735|nr:hypothetical protein [Nodosilinea nodulosa]